MEMSQANTTELGALISRHDNKSKIRNVLVLVGLGIAGFVAGNLVNQLDDPPGLIIIILWLGGVLMMLSGLVTLPIALIKSGNQVVVYEKGFTYKIGRNTDTVRWENIFTTNFGQRLEQVESPGGALGGLFAGMMESDRKFTVFYNKDKHVKMTTADISKITELAKEIKTHIKPVAKELL